MSTKSTTFRFARSQQPKARIEPIQIRAVEVDKQDSLRQPARRTRSSSSKSQPNTERQSAPQGSEALPLGRRPKPRNQEKIQPKTARRQRAFQIGAIRPKFRKAQIKGSTLQSQSKSKNRKAASIENAPEFKKVKI